MTVSISPVKSLNDQVNVGAGLFKKSRYPECPYCGEDLQQSGGHGMLCIRDYGEVFRIGHIIPPVVGIVGLLELVHRRIDHEFRHC